jgi:hypothetical protein
MYIYTYIYTYIHTHMYICIHIYTHTYKQIDPDESGQDTGELTRHAHEQRVCVRRQDRLCGIRYVGLFCLYIRSLLTRDMNNTSAILWSATTRSPLRVRSAGSRSVLQGSRSLLPLPEVLFGQKET